MSDECSRASLPALLLLSVVLLLLLLSDKLELPDEDELLSEELLSEELLPEELLPEELLDEPDDEEVAHQRTAVPCVRRATSLVNISGHVAQ